MPAGALLPSGRVTEVERLLIGAGIMCGTSKFCFGCDGMEDSGGITTGLGVIGADAIFGTLIGVGKPVGL